MNKLILIGNGFDLAHGMKTSYKDFLIDHMRTAMLSAMDGGRFSNDDFDIVSNIDFYGKFSFIQALRDAQQSQQLILDVFSGAEFLTYGGGKYQNAISTYIKNPILDLAVDCCFINGWADIEQIYYDKLIEVTSLEERDKEASIVELNGALTRIKDNLHEYLKGLPEPVSLPYMYDVLNELFDSSDFLDGSANLDKCDHILVLNFNYTYTPDLYIHSLTPKFEYTPIIDSIHIHGELYKEENPLIFGFGDEMDDHYKVLERMNDNRFLDNIKSFGYFRTDNLRKLSRFLDEGEYQVQIMGHSCGLSDRVMLNRVFEHEKCRSIKIFHYHKGDTFEETNYKEQTQNISRHFNKKQRMRDLVAPYKKENFLPQATG